MKRFAQLSLLASLSIFGHLTYAQDVDTTALLTEGKIEAAMQDQAQTQKAPSKAKLLRAVMSLQVTVSLKLDELGVEPVGDEAEISSGLLDHSSDLESLTEMIKKTEDNDKATLVELGKQIKLSHQNIMSLIRNTSK